MHRHLVGRALSPLVLATAQITAGALLLAASAFLIAHQDMHLTVSVVASVLALGALGTGVAYILNYRLIQDEGATSASTITYLLPIVAVILGAIILAEPITWRLFAGTILVLVGIALTDNRFSARPTQTAGQLDDIPQPPPTEQHKAFPYQPQGANPRSSTRQTATVAYSDPR